MNISSEIDWKAVAYFFKKSEALKNLELQLTQFRSPNPPAYRHWLQNLRQGLGISYAALAHRLEISRQAVQQMEEREPAGKITIEHLEKIASHLDCEFVYGFIPKRRDLFSEILTHRARKFIEKPKLPNEYSRSRQQSIMTLRIQKFLKTSSAGKKIWNSGNRP